MSVLLWGIRLDAKVNWVKGVKFWSDPFIEAYFSLSTIGELINFPSAQGGSSISSQFALYYICISTKLRRGRPKTSSPSGGVEASPFSSRRKNHSYFWPIILTFSQLILVFGQSFRQNVLKQPFLKQGSPTFRFFFPHCSTRTQFLKVIP